MDPDALLLKAHAARRTAKGSITRIESFIKANAGTLLHKLEYDTRLELLETSFKKFCESQDVIEVSETDVDKIGDPSEYEEKYCNLKTQLKILINDCSPKDVVQGTIQQSNQTNSSQNINGKAEVKSKMPEIVIDKFAGAHQSWSSFYDIFKALVLDNDDLADIQKLIYLKSNLMGEPQKLIANLPLVASNLSVAIDILKERYENKLANIYVHIKGLLDVPSINKSNSMNLRDFVVSVKQHTECLKNLNVPIAQWDLILVYILSQKLDINTRRGYELERGPTFLPTLDGFLKFVEKRCQAAENLVSPELSHKNSHFANKTVCIFKPVCEWKNCPICGKAHNTLLHAENSVEHSSNRNNSHNNTRSIQQNLSFSSNREPTNHKQNFYPMNDSSSNSDQVCNIEQNSEVAQASISDKHGAQSNAMSSLFINQNAHILLATASVHVSNNNGHLISARAVLDSGSQVSLITHKLAKKLLYPTYNKNLLISGVSGHMKVSEGIDIKLFSKVDPTKTFEVNCSVTNFISSKLPQFPIQTNRLEIPCSIVLADPSYDVPDHVDLLLGADVYYSLLLPGLISLGDNLPILQNTHLGWVVGGVLSPTILSNFITFDQVPSHSLFINFNQIDTLLQKFWAVEDVPQGHILSSEDELSEQIFKNIMLDKNSVEPLNQIC